MEIFYREVPSRKVLGCFQIRNVISTGPYAIFDTYGAFARFVRREFELPFGVVSILSATNDGIDEAQAFDFPQTIVVRHGDHHTATFDIAYSSVVRKAMQDLAIQ